MANTPTHIVQSFHKQGKKLVADQARKMNSAQAAIEAAQRLQDRKAGVVAYSIVHEPESDLVGEPTILFKAGELPRELSEQ